MSWLSTLLQDGDRQSRNVPRKYERDFMSIRRAARELGCSENKVRELMGQHKKPSDCLLKRGKRRPINIAGVTYKSVRAASKALSLNRKVIYHLIGEGWRIK